MSGEERALTGPGLVAVAMFTDRGPLGRLAWGGAEPSW